MERVVPLTVGETYHIFNRGAHKQSIFNDEYDLRRFQLLLCLANTSTPINLRGLKTRKGESFAGLFETAKSDKGLVDMLAYTLMPNHFHIVVRQKAVEGVSLFMRKLCTAYSMYFNAKHGHSGTVFEGPFKSSHISTDPYFNWVFAYVHLNAVSMVEPAWDERKIENPTRAQEYLNRYPFSSYFDYYTGERPERNILAYLEGREFIEKKTDIQNLLRSYGNGEALFNRWH